MSLDYLKREWELVKTDIRLAKSEEEKNRMLRYAKSISDTAMEVFGVDLYVELGGLD